MNQRKYVQHISGQGEKWKVRECSYNSKHENKTWVIDHDFKISSNHMELPRSEYIYCDPPEEYEDVTGEFIVTGSNWPSPSESKSNAIICANTGYIFWAPHEMHHGGDLLLEKIDGLHHGPAFVVKRKKS